MTFTFNLLITAQERNANTVRSRWSLHWAMLVGERNGAVIAISPKKEIGALPSLGGTVSMDLIRASAPMRQEQLSGAYHGGHLRGVEDIDV
ncbi:hypothetical protein [Mycobacterium saskatchewanense]|uniref:hypothetical protein n=1 Tax=Mycobacterium saskatchewanense TaxID=220927 RepID=UPI001150781E|nr:hypothetical protein [Mycobacterium saskatchewanense]